MKRYLLVLLAVILAYSCSNNMAQIATGYNENQTNEETLWSNLGTIGTGIDSNGDGVPDGIDVNNDGVADMVLLDTTGSSRRVDINSNGVVDFYMNIDNLNNVTFSTAINGGGSPVVIKYNSSNVAIGYDTNGDGIADINLSGVTIVYYTVGGTITPGGTINPLNSDMILSLKVNGTFSQNITVLSTADTYQFTTQLENSSTYEVAIVSYPSGQNCILTVPSGLISGANASVPLTCGVYETTLDSATISSLFGDLLDTDFNGIPDKIDIDYDGTYNTAVDIDIIGNTGDGQGLTLDIDGAGTDFYLCRNASGVYQLQAVCGGAVYSIVKRNGVPIGYDTDADGLAEIDLNNLPMYTITINVTLGTETWVTYEVRLNGDPTTSTYETFTANGPYLINDTFSSADSYMLVIKGESTGISWPATKDCTMTNEDTLVAITGNMTETLTCP